MFGKGIVLLLVVALVALGWTKHRDRIREQDRLAVIASSIVGHKVGVRCPNIVKKLVYASAEGGSVEFDERGRPADHMELAPETCDALRHVAKTDFSCFAASTCGDKEFRIGWAMHTLAHEAFHLRGISQESRAECYAMQTTASVAISLGIASGRAEQLQRWVWTKGYPNEPTEYWTPECGNGGPLDLHPASPFWP
jgi:hypothetical protein